MSNAVGIHCGVFVGDWTVSSADRAMGLAREAGFDTIEISVFNAATLDAAMTRTALDRHGLTPTCSLGLPFDADIASEDGETVARGERYLLDAFRFASEVGSGYVGGVIYGAFGRHPSPPTVAMRDASVRAMRRLAEAAERLNVVIGLELVNRYESNLLNTVEQGLGYLDDVGAGNVVLHLDSYHMNIEEVDPSAAIALAGDRLGYFHIGESNRGALGTGNVDFAAIGRALADVSYGGHLTFESFSSAVLDPNLSNTLAIWRNTWTYPLQVATSARHFITKHLTA